MKAEKPDATLGELIGSLATDTGVLVRQELELAVAEMAKNARDAARCGGMVATGGLLLHLSGIAALVCLMAALQPVLPLWAVAGGLALVLAVPGWAMVQVGVRGIRRVDVLPNDALNTLRPDGARS